MPRQGSLFAKPKAKRRVLMHVDDAGGAEHGRALNVTLRCSKCGYRSEWLQCDTVTEAKRGQPCPRCN